jgi:hypothetical protein
MKTALSRAIPALFVLASNGSARACSACWNPAGGEKMNHAATVGIFAMVVIMFIMLGSLLAFGFYFAHRAKQAYPDYDELLSDDTTPHTPNPETSS